MQESFKVPPRDSQDPESQAGALWRKDLERGESVAQMDLFKGAIGLFKNPASHRRVDYNDPTEAAEVVLLADLQMRLLNKIESTDRPPTHPRDDHEPDARAASTCSSATCEAAPTISPLRMRSSTESSGTHSIRSASLMSSGSPT